MPTANGTRFQTRFMAVTGVMMAQCKHYSALAHGERSGVESSPKLPHCPYYHLSTRNVPARSGREVASFGLPHQAHQAHQALQDPRMPICHVPQCGTTIFTREMFPLASEASPDLFRLAIDRAEAYARSSPEAGICGQRPVLEYWVRMSQNV